MVFFAEKAAHVHFSVCDSKSVNLQIFFHWMFFSQNACHNERDTTTVNPLVFLIKRYMSHLRSSKLGFASTLHSPCKTPDCFLTLCIGLLNLATLILENLATKSSVSQVGIRSKTFLRSHTDAFSWLGRTDNIGRHHFYVLWGRYVVQRGRCFTPFSCAYKL